MTYDENEYQLIIIRSLSQIQKNSEGARLEMAMLINVLEKGENKLGMHVRRCGVCDVQLGEEHAMTSLARYRWETGSMITNTEMTCIRCVEDMVGVREIVEEEGLDFGSDSALFKRTIQPLLSEMQFSPPSPTPDTYYHHLEREIKQKQLHHCAHLPQNIRQLLYYSSFSIPQPERHERIRNTILTVMIQCAIPLESLEDIAVLVQALFSFMNQSSILQIFFSLRQANSDSLSFLNTSKDQIPSFDTQSHANLWWSLYSDQSIRSLLKNIQLLLAAEKENCLLKSSKGCENCGKVTFNANFQLNTIRNHFYLIYEELLKQDESLRQFIKQQELKFYKQKEEFINKIIKLKDRISFLEGEERDRAKSVSDGEVNEIVNDTRLKRASSLIHERSEKGSETIRKNRKVDIYLSPEQEPKKQSSKSQTLTVKDLHPLLISLPELDPSLLSETTSPKHVLLTIQSSISRLQTDLAFLEKKCQQSQLEAKRLLQILTRKQEQYIPLIHEKDLMIEKYENALWRMENNFLVEDESLKPRIDAITKLFTSNILEAQRLLTQEEQRKEKNVERQEKKKKQESDKQCCIY